MVKQYQVVLCIAFLFIGGCSNEEDKATLEQSSKETILEGHARALEKAKEVEQVLQREADKRRQAIEEQSK